MSSVGHIRAHGEYSEKVRTFLLEVFATAEHKLSERESLINEFSSPDYIYITINMYKRLIDYIYESRGMEGCYILYNLLLESTLHPTGKVISVHLKELLSAHINIIKTINFLTTKIADGENLINEVKCALGKVSSSAQRMILNNRIKNWTHLALACRMDKIELAKFLIGQGSSVNFATEIGETPLMCACRSRYVPGKADIVEELIKSGADTNTKNNNGDNPLTLACMYRTGSVKALLDNGAKVNVHGKDGKTPLSIAAERKDTSLVKLLLSNGANPNLRDLNGNSPISSANGNNEIILRLVKAGGVLSLVESTRMGKRSLVDYSIRRNIGIYERDENGHNALMIAVQSDNLEIIESLLAIFDINGRSGKGETPLILASAGGFKLSVATLLKNGAQTELVDGNGMDASDHSYINGHTDIYNILCDSTIM